VSSGDDTRRARRLLGTGRMEAFSDGVFSIAATLLVLDIAIHPPGSPLHQVLHAWPFYLAYVVSFLTIGATWLAHTALTDRLARADRLLLRINLLLLLAVAFLPFPTKLVANALHQEGSERVFVTLYGVTLLAIRMLAFALNSYARRAHLYAPANAEDGPTEEPQELMPVVIGYVAAILIGIAFPGVAVAIYFALAVYMILFREITRRLRVR